MVAVDNPQSGAEVRSAAVSNSRVRLRTVTPRDYDYLYQLALDPASSFRWRYRGATPSPDEFHRNLWQGVLAQFLVQEASTNRHLGHVAAFDASHRDGWVHVAALADPAAKGRGYLGTY